MEKHLKYQMNRISFIAHNLKILLNLQTVAILIVTQFLTLVCVVKESLMILTWDLMIGNQHFLWFTHNLIIDFFISDLIYYLLQFVDSHISWGHYFLPFIFYIGSCFLFLQ